MKPDETGLCSECGHSAARKGTKHYHFDKKNGWWWTAYFHVRPRKTCPVEGCKCRECKGFKDKGAGSPGIKH